MNIPFPSTNALRSAAAARLSSSPLSDLDAGNLPFIDTSHDSGVQSATDNALNDRLATLLGGGPAVHASRLAADEARMQQGNDERAQLADLESGVPEEIGMTQSGIANRLADVNSEAGYARKTLPFAQQAQEQDDANALALADARYGAPARAKAAGDLAAAQAGAQGRVGAAQARDTSLPLRGLYEALSAMMAKSGKIPSPDEIKQLQALYSVK